MRWIALLALLLLPGCIVPPEGSPTSSPPHSRVLIERTFDLSAPTWSDGARLSVPSLMRSGSVEVTRTGSLMGLGWTFAGCGGDDGGALAIESTQAFASSCSPIATGSQELKIEAESGRGEVRVLIVVHP